MRFFSPKPIISTSFLSVLTSLLAAVTLSLSAVSVPYAADSSSVPKKMQTELGLYFMPTEAYEHVIKHGNQTLFIDVRDPIEVNFIGMPTVADANIPLKFADTSKWHMKKKQFGMRSNKNFVADVDKRLNDKGLTKSNVVILMCRSGPRGAAGVNLLAKAGFTNVYNLIEGFEGVSIAEGPDKGQRTVNGWKNSGLPWDVPKSLDIKKMYGDPVPVVPKS